MRLAHGHGEQLRRFLVTRVRNPADVPDLIQEIFLRLLRVPNHETIRSPEAYLFTVAQHVAQQHGLRQSENAASLELNQMLRRLRVVPEIDPALEVEAQLCLEALQGALDELSPKAQAAFLLHRRDGLSLEAVGDRLGVSRPMAKKYLAKVLLHLRQRLEDTSKDIP